MIINNIFIPLSLYIKRINNFIMALNSLYIFYFGILLLIFNFIWIILNLIKKPRKKEEQVSIQDFLKLIPLKTCYWQENNKDFFVHEDIPTLLKSNLYGYGIIQFILNYNQDIKEQFTKLQLKHKGHFKILLNFLAVEVGLYKNGSSYFLLLNKIDKKTQDTIIKSAINDMTGNITWIEAEDTVIFRNNLGEKYKTLLSTLQYQDKNKILSIDNTLYKYNKYSNQSYTIHMLNEIEEFKNFHRDEKNKELIYNFLSLLKEKFVILNRSGKIIFISEGLKAMIQIPTNQQIYDIKDLFTIMNNSLSLPDEINFNSYMENMKNKILNCEINESEYFSSLDGKIFSRSIFPKAAHVMLVFEDITKQIAHEKEQLQNKLIQDFYWNNLEEGIIVFNSYNKLLFNNKTLLNFINEKFIQTKDDFNNNLYEDKTINESNENLKKIYLSTSIDNKNKFTMIENRLEELTLYLIKPYKESIPDRNMEYFNNLIKEIENQWRYLNYVKMKETDIKTIEQINFIFKSLNKVKIYTLSIIDFYDEKIFLATKFINLIEFINIFLQNTSDIYNKKNIVIDNDIKSYNIITDPVLLERAMWYFFEFFYSFFLINNKKINVKMNQDKKLVMLMEVGQKFNYENPFNTKLVYVMQKLFKILNFEVNLIDEDNEFIIIITFI